jgi:hypothetical protein
MLSDKKKFERLADKLLRLADSMVHAQDLKEGRPSRSHQQIRHQSLLILDADIKALRSLLE